MAAGDAVVRGVNDFTEQPLESVFDMREGWKHTRIFEGPLDETKISALVASLKSTCNPIEIHRGWPTVIRATLTFQTSVSVGPESDLDLEERTEWALEAYDLQNALASHGAFNSSDVSPTYLVKVDADINNGTAYGNDYDVIFPGVGAPSHFNDYVKLRGQGTESWLSFGFTLRRTVEYPIKSLSLHRAQEPKGELVPGKVVTWAQICAATAPYNPEYYQLKQPRLHYYKGRGEAWVDEDVAEWLIKPPSVTVSGRGAMRRAILTQEFLGALKWSALLYHGGTGTP